MARVFKRVLIAGAMSTNSKSWKWVGRQYNVSKWFYNPIYEDCKVSQRSNFYKLLFDLPKIFHTHFKITLESFDRLEKGSKPRDKIIVAKQSRYGSPRGVRRPAMGKIRTGNGRGA